MGTYAEQLTDESGVKPGEETSSDGKQRPRYGPLLDLPEQEAFDRALRLWNMNQREHKRLAAVWKRNRWWRDGKRFIKIIESTDSDEIRLSVPLGMEGMPPVPNACDYKIRDLVARMLVDPPKPECEPWDDTARAREAAHFATRFLTIESSEAGLNIDNVFAAAMDIAGTYGSAFTYVCYDPKGGGLQPEEISAHPDARHRDEAETGPEGALPKPAVRRYVMPDGSLSEHARGANRVWVPKLRLHQFTGNNVRFLPRTCTGIEDALGVVCAWWTTLGDCKSRFPRVAKMTPKEQWELVTWKLPEWKRLLPEGTEYEPPRQAENDQKAPDDDAPVLTLCVYYKSHPEYPYGAYVCFGGGRYRLHKQTWTANTPDANGGFQNELLDLPFSQARWITDAQGGNPYGKAPAEKLGPMDEMRATQYAAALEYLYRFSRPRPFLPMGTIVQPEDLADPDKPILFNPQGKPEWQPMPPYPEMGIQLIDRVDVEMDREVSVFDPGRGLAAGSIRSAEQQQQIVEQGQAGTSYFRANMEDYYERLCRIILQQARAWYQTPQLMRYQGDGGSYQVREWSNIDLGSTREVRVRKGSFTLMTPTLKANLVTQELQAGMITPIEAYRLKRDNLGPMLGLPENPHVERVKRQLWLWRQGPGEELEGAEPRPQMGPDGQPIIDPTTGQPVMVDPLQQAAESIFSPLPVDEEPEVAVLRHQELSRAVSEMETHGFPEGWNNGLLNVYLRARQAAGVQTLAEQRMAMQQQQEAQARQVQEQRQMQREAHEIGLRQKQESHEQGLSQKAEKAALDQQLRAMKGESGR